MGCQKVNHQSLKDYCDCFIFFNEENSSLSTDLKKKVYCTDTVDLLANAEKNVLIFYSNGVYSNAIPYPHKIFHFNKLNKDALEDFFSWATKLNLFKQQEL